MSRSDFSVCVEIRIVPLFEKLSKIMSNFGYFESICCVKRYGKKFKNVSSVNLLDNKKLMINSFLKRFGILWSNKIISCFSSFRICSKIDESDSSTNASYPGSISCGSVQIKSERINDDRIK